MQRNAYKFQEFSCINLVNNTISKNHTNLLDFS